MDWYLGEIRVFAGNYAPRGWALCDGTPLKVVEYEALFSLLGFTWGGDNSTTFKLPDLRGRIPVGQGSGPALTPRTLGQNVGTETVSLTADQCPMHSHLITATKNVATATTPGPGVVLATLNAPSAHYVPTGVLTNPSQRDLGTDAISVSGGSSPHDNIMPCLTLNYIIALQGIYPTRD